MCLLCVLWVGKAYSDIVTSRSGKKRGLHSFCFREEKEGGGGGGGGGTWGVGHCVGGVGGKGGNGGV